jgi:type II secretory pathway pseudopilin PulG
MQRGRDAALRGRFLQGPGGSVPGYTLAELLILLAVLAGLLIVALPGLAEAHRAAALNAAARRLYGLMIRCRAHALVCGRATSLVFERDGSRSWRCFIAQDGDGDGVRRDDLRRGRDRVIGEVLALEGAIAGLGILHDRRIPDPSGRGSLGGNLDDPVRAGRGDIITFTPASTATPSSVYLSDHHHRMRVLRIYGGTARIVSLVWRDGWQEWRPTGL